MDQEIAFHDLTAGLAQPTSGRWKLHLLLAFIDRLEPGSASADAYLLELSAPASGILSSLDPNGLGPEVVRRLLDRLEALVAASPTLRGYDEAARLLDRLRAISAERCACVGDFDAVFELLRTNDTPVPDWWIRAAAEGRSAGDPRRTLRLLQEEALRNDASLGELLGGLGPGGEGMPGRMPRHIDVPVVEYGVGDPDPTRAIGGLRSVEVHLLGDVEGEDDLKPDVASGPRPEVNRSTARSAIQAGRRLLEALEPRARQRYFGGYVHFGLGGVSHDGSSAGLALALGFASAAQRRLGLRTTLEPVAGVAMTGAVTSTADVLPVDPGSLPLKVRAAFHSWNRVLVLPESHLAEATRLVAELEVTHPGRTLELVGVRSLRDAASDRRLMRSTRTPLPIHLARSVVRYRSHLAGAVLSVAALAAIFLATGPPRDTNPVEAVADGRALVFENAAGQEVYRLPFFWDSLAVRFQQGIRLDYVVTLADFDGDGRNEACFGVHGAPAGHLLRCIRVPEGTRLWPDRVLEFDVDYPDDPTITSERFFIRGIAARDFDRDGMPELLLTLSHEQQHPAIVLRIDPETFEVFNRYDHAGAFYVMDLADLDGDGRAEVLLGGTNNALQSAVIVALDPVGFRGTGPSLGHRRHGLPLTGGELAYLRFVPSSVAKALGTRENNVNNSDRGIAVEGERIFVQVYATSIFLDDQTRKRAMLTYGFDNRLRALSVTTDDFYWEVLAGLMAEGRLPYRTNKAEVDSLLRGIRYWDGEGWRDSVWTRLGEGMSTAAPTP